MKEDLTPGGEHVNCARESFEEISAEVLKKHVLDLKSTDEPKSHTEILQQLIQQFRKVNFEALVQENIAKETDLLKENSGEVGEQKFSKEGLKRNHYLILAIEIILATAKTNKWGLCTKNDVIYLYNGCYWSVVEQGDFEKFLGDAVEKLGVPKFSAKFYLFREQLFKQFMSMAYFPSPKEDKNKVLINLLNGTFEITQFGAKLRPFCSDDFLTHQLPFCYDPAATSPLFDKYYHQVLPDEQSRLVLMEYLAFIFIKHSSKVMKEEKALILYGSGANGKSVFFEIVSALLGEKNVSNYSLQQLTNESGYQRYMIADKLLNYCTEINGKLEVSVFKQLVSGEPVDARLPYGAPVILTQYAKLIFNCNELPKDVEQTNAFFRRFLIVPFTVTIAPENQDKNLHTKIISAEMPGILNYVVKALDRIIRQQKFSKCDAARLEIERYKIQSDSVRMFLEDCEYVRSTSKQIALKDLFYEYRTYCFESNFRECSLRKFADRLRSTGFEMIRKKTGQVVNAAKKVLI